jgi:hypothetical protein
MNVQDPTNTSSSSENIGSVHNRSLFDARFEGQKVAVGFRHEAGFVHFDGEGAAIVAAALQLGKPAGSEVRPVDLNATFGSVGVRDDDNLRRRLSDASISVWEAESLASMKQLEAAWFESNERKLRDLAAALEFCPTRSRSVAIPLA